MKETMTAAQDQMEKGSGKGGVSDRRANLP
jgi:hypothetical protein